MSSIPAHDNVYLIQHYVIEFVSGFLIYSGILHQYIADCHDIIAILLKVALNTITIFLWQIYTCTCVFRQRQILLRNNLMFVNLFRLYFQHLSWREGRC